MFLILIKFFLLKSSLALLSLQCQEKCTVDHTLISFCCTNGKLSSENLKLCYSEHSSNKQSIFNLNLINISLTDNDPLDLNYLSNFTEKILINKTNISELPKINNLNNLKILKINSHKIYHLVKSDFGPSSLEIIDLAEGYINLIKNDFFIKFENLKEVNLQRNIIYDIGQLKFNSNFIRLIDFSFQKVNGLKYFDGIYFLNKNSDPRLVINFDSNQIHKFPKILGNLRNIYYYKIGHQFNQDSLLNTHFISISDDGPIVIENFEIYDQHFLVNKDYKHFQCLLDYGVIKNVILSGQTKHKYTHHITKKNFDFENCKIYVSTSTAATSNFFTEKDNTTISITIKNNATKTQIAETIKSTASFRNKEATLNSTLRLLTAQSTKLLKLTSYIFSIKQSQKIENSFRNRILDYIMDNPGVVVSIFALIFIFFLFLFVCFDYAIERINLKKIFYFRSKSRGRPQ
ncbi:unnamed protein product [Brachionus calyciflorus]|uniref:Uncharacterized protein n=1 Tax=Brachionus calyciflorus TaxID=104777 RepID=A0A813SNJ8_9BILA|nr:unnamed protein product [Brachionus calyciflorus]